MEAQEIENVTDAPEVRHKDKLTALRSKSNERPRFSSGRGHNAPRKQEDGSTERTGERLDSLDPSGEGRASIGTQGVEAEPGVIGRSDSGVRPAITETSLDSSGYGQEGSSTEPASQQIEVLVERDLLAERQRKREMARQRQQRKRDKDAQSQTVLEVGGDGNARDNFASKDNVEVRIRNVTPSKNGKPVEEVKLFTKLEADEKLEKLTYILVQGSSLIDDLVEIIVKGHEKVDIWKLSDDEANMIAMMMTEEAKKSKAMAKQVRTIIAVYDKMYMFMLLGPRVVQTGRHIKSHGGFSIR